MATTANTITATAGQTEFSFSFPYLKKESIKVTIDTVATTAFTIPDNNPTTVVLNNGATAGQVIVISRVTSTTATPSTFFSGGAIRSQDLNDNFDSILYITQEKENQLTEVIAGGIADGSITSSKLADQSVGTAALIDGGVATVDLADNAVTTTKIADSAVTTAKIVDSAVTTAKIVDSAVTTAKIVDSAVTTAKIADNAVTTAKIADNAVTPAKLDRSYVSLTGASTMTGSLKISRTGTEHLIIDKPTSTDYGGMYFSQNGDARYLFYLPNVDNADLSIQCRKNGTNIRSALAIEQDTGLCKFNSGVHLPDNQVLSLGSSKDAEFFCNGTHLYLDLNSGINNFYIRDGTTSRFIFDDSGIFTSSGIRYTGYSGTMRQGWSSAQGGIISQIVDSASFKLCYSAGNNITWAWNQFSQVVATIDGTTQVVCGSASDYRLKENVELSTYGTDAVKALRPVTYTLKRNGEQSLGFIAHEAAEAVPGAATGEKDGEMMQSINTYPIVVTLTKALQESIERIEALEAKVQTLENN